MVQPAHFCLHSLRGGLKPIKAKCTTMNMYFYQTLGSKIGRLSGFICVFEREGESGGEALISALIH